MFSETSPDETDSQREAKRNLILSLVTGLAAATGGDAATAGNAATAAVDNNWLATQQVIQMNKELAAAETLSDKLKVAGKWSEVLLNQGETTVGGIIDGLRFSLDGDIVGVGNFLLDTEAGLSNLKTLVSSPEMIAQLGAGAVDSLVTRLDAMAHLITIGGNGDAYLLGKNLGELIWDVSSAVLVVKGAAKGTASLAKTGITVSDNAYLGLSKSGAAGSGAGVIVGFTIAESKVIAEAQRILNSSELTKIQAAHVAGKPVTVNIGGRLLQYEPNMPASGMTMFGENGFLIGREAFASPQEFQKTILHELYRLETSQAAMGVSGALATQETKAAASFAEKAAELLK